jgi:uncharacterized protein
MIPRQAESYARKLASFFRIVSVAGPRQSGKTTLARAAFAHLPYVSLEDGEAREAALRDPKYFLGNFPNGALLDEVQRAPGLLNYLQTIVDLDPRPGRWVITGSQQFGLMDGVTQSLAGRVGLLELLPLSNAELAVAGKQQRLDATLWQGSYPANARLRDPVLVDAWYNAYLRTYVERDVRQMLNVGDLGLFRRFIALCAARSGQLLNLNALAADCGISQPTARKWLSVLEASYLILLVQPYFKNFGKRLTKAPKLYFLDTGLMCHLLRVARSGDLAFHASRGALFETWVISETVKHRFNRGLAANLHYLRDNHGNEADLVYETGLGKLQVVEIKSGATFSDEWIRAANRVAGYLGDDSAGKPFVVHGGQESLERSHAWAISWRDLGLSV